MLTPALDRLLDLAAQNIACARSALARGQYATAETNATAASDLISHFNRRLNAPATSGPITAPDNSSITTTPTPEKAEAKTAPTLREGTRDGV